MPTEKLLSCPMCQEKPQRTLKYLNVCYCSNNKCSLFGIEFLINKWNTRTPSPELVELRKDKERLDWLSEKEHMNATYDMTAGGEVKFGITTEYGMEILEPTLRTAIDAAKEKK